MKKFLILAVLSLAIVSGTATATFSSDTETFQALDKGDMT
ncbi:hypothetical protein JOC54_002675 [Alkalihalobacillus xiaoxiensis]|uniref:Uncharacterized protein n=1 Tax=Shouchella xiaoxiensis TaxID=766895 RepID=A0ABS2SV40_9BACI|nr:hypothetical protein [Shouchella xiaoxiensis]